MENFDWTQYSIEDIWENWLMSKAKGFPSSPAKWWEIIYEGFSTNTRWWTTGAPGAAITLDDGSLLSPVALGGSTGLLHPVCFLRRVGKAMYIYARTGDSAEEK